ncbi:hypothetical protein FS837_003557 [Tulasnella sp. UAMH 9824]|nr:hypothetical protein FS837_003557 [Tulasnella sp. UAMH 9824]
MTDFRPVLDVPLDSQLLALLTDSVVDIETRCASMKAELLRTAKPLFGEIKRNHPGLLLSGHTHAGSVRDSCELVQDYGFCFPKLFRDALELIREYKRCASAEFKGQFELSDSEDVANRYKTLVYLLQQSYDEISKTALVDVIFSSFER